jgi:hypothetical protein
METMPKMYYRGADGALLAYDITDYTSFQRVKRWVDQILQASDDFGSEPPPMILGTLLTLSLTAAGCLYMYKRGEAHTACACVRATQTVQSAPSPTWRSAGRWRLRKARHSLSSLAPNGWRRAASPEAEVRPSSADASTCIAGLVIMG